MKKILSHLKINGKQVGNNKNTYIIFEAGPTHNGLSSAKKLVDMAKIAGADAIKFQILDTNLISDINQVFTYKYLATKKKDIIKVASEPLHKILKRREMKMSQWKKLSEYCCIKKITFFATASNFYEIDFLKDIGCDTVKIASADINHYPLLSHAAKSGMIVQIDTGMADLYEINEAVKLISRYNNKIIIHHCPSGYPAEVSDINLNIIKTLKSKFNCPIAYSDHSPGYDMDIAAVALGANILEKTITLDKTIKSPEHMMSLEFQDMIDFVENIKKLDSALGKFDKKFSVKQKISRKLLRRSVFLVEDAKKNQKLKDVNVVYKRPERGMTPEFFFKNKFLSLKKNIKKGKILKIENVKKN